MNTAVINIKIDPKTKKEAKIVADELGFSLSSLTVALLKQVIRKRSVNFNLNLEEPSPYLIRILKQNRRDFKAGRISPTFTNAQDALKYLQ